MPVAEAAAEFARAGGVRVAVIPTRASVQVLAALAVHDPGRRYDDDVVSMTAAARATRTGSITTAVRESLTSAGVCHPGDVLGLIEGDVVRIGTEIEATARDVLDRMLMAGGELVTLLLGADVPDGLAERLERHLAQTHPEVEVGVHDGGQPLYPCSWGGVAVLEDPVQTLVGDRTAKILRSGLGIETVGDLLRHYPRRYAERGELTDLASLQLDEYVTVMAEIASVNNRPMRDRRGSLLVVEVTDGHGRLSLTFFNQAWRERDLTVGRHGLFSGKVGVPRQAPA